jgi:predicted metal-dependent hydrolase
MSQAVKIRRSKLARRISLKINAVERSAILVLPERASQASGMAFLNQHLDWLREKLAALPEALPFIPGAEIPLLGQTHRLAPVPGARRGVWAEDGLIHVSGPAEFFSRRVADFLKAEAKRRITALAHPMASSIGRECANIRVGDPKSRWGSCNRKGRLAFSWRLVLAPEPVLAYVVAHEVAHLREMNHSAKFWDWVRLLHPDLETERRWLKQNGAGLYRYG